MARLNRDQSRRHCAPLAREDVVGAARGAGVHRIVGDTGLFELVAKSQWDRQELGPAPNQADIQRAREFQNRREGLQRKVRNARDRPRDHAPRVDDDRAPVFLIGDTETAAAVLLDLRLRTRRLAREVDRNGRYSAGLGARSYSGTGALPAPGVSSRRKSV